MNKIVPEEEIRKRLNETIDETFFSFGKKIKGKVRDNYLVDGRRVMVATDRISAFDRVLGTIPLKGQVLNQLAVFWLEKTRDIFPNHLLETPDPNVSVVREAVPLPVEVVVRGYITGSLWRAYDSGQRKLYGIEFPEGLRMNQRFDKPIITPTTKEEYGKHDEPISREEIISQGLVSEDVYEEIEKAALSLFEFGSSLLRERGLILVDTKYEFGLIEGKPVLIDEIHTPDSSRFWYIEEYGERFSKGEPPKALDKEYVRNWLRARGFSGEGSPPELTEEVRVSAAQRYIEAFELITGQDFVPGEVPVLERIKKNLKKAGFIRE